MVTKPSKATLKDVAQQAGVSVSTVSRFLNHTLELPLATRDRIETAIQRLHYRPNRLARSLQSGRSHILGLVVPELTNPFFAAIADYAADQASLEGYSLLLCTTGNSAQREAGYVSLLGSGQLDGLVYLGGHRTNAALEEVTKGNLPVVVVDEEVEDISAARLFVDNRRGGYLATEHLLHLGHRDIAHIGGHPGLLTTVERQLGYQEALDERGVEADPSRVLLGEYTSAFGRSAALELLRSNSRPTAIFAGSDILAVGVLQAARQVGLDVPGELSLVGFDDIPIAELLLPPLTTVRQPVEELAREALRLLVAQIETRRVAPPKTLGVRLKVRSSTASRRT